jgi:hypothetical protein
MAFCDGNGAPNEVTPERGGCCFVDGNVCPLRLMMVNGHVIDAEGTDLGTVDDWLKNDKGVNNKAARERAATFAAGITFACHAAVQAVIDDPSLRADRVAFNEAWEAMIEQMAPEVHAHWDAIGMDYCSIWTGSGKPQCCFERSDAATLASATDLDADERALRAAAPGASDPGA